jgi:hypothetical protein
VGSWAAFQMFDPGADGFAAGVSSSCAKSLTKVKRVMTGSRTSIKMRFFMGLFVY